MGKSNEQIATGIIYLHEVNKLLLHTILGLAHMCIHHGTVHLCVSVLYICAAACMHTCVRVCVLCVLLEHATRVVWAGACVVCVCAGVCGCVWVYVCVVCVCYYINRRRELQFMT